MTKYQAFWYVWRVFSGWRGKEHLNGSGNVMCFSFLVVPWSTLHVLHADAWCRWNNFSVLSEEISDTWKYWMMLPQCFLQPCGRGPCLAFLSPASNASTEVEIYVRAGHWFFAFRTKDILQVSFDCFISDFRIRCVVPWNCFFFCLYLAREHRWIAQRWMCKIEMSPNPCVSTSLPPLHFGFITDPR